MTEGAELRQRQVNPYLDLVVAVETGGQIKPLILIRTVAADLSRHLHLKHRQTCEQPITANLNSDVTSGVRCVRVTLLMCVSRSLRSARRSFSPLRRSDKTPSSPWYNWPPAIIRLTHMSCRGRHKHYYITGRHMGPFKGPPWEPEQDSPVWSARTAVWGPGQQGCPVRSPLAAGLWSLWRGQGSNPEEDRKRVINTRRRKRNSQSEPS